MRRAVESAVEPAVEQRPGRLVEQKRKPVAGKLKPWWQPRQTADLHNLFYHTLIVVSYAAAFWIYAQREALGIQGPGEVAAFVLGSAFMLGWASGVDLAVNFHNHAHVPIFRSDFLNRWLTRFWAVTSGWPGFVFAYAHLEVHHKFLVTGRDWTLPKRRADGTHEHIVLYSLTYWPFRVVGNVLREFRFRVADPALRRQVAIEVAIFLCMWLLPFLIDVKMALLLWVFPQWIGNVILVGAGMHAQHAGCVPGTDERPFEHSNTCISPAHNLTMFNIGYHICHHEWPTVHWTKLPKMHQDMHAYLQAKGGRLFDYGYYKTASIMASLFTRDARRKAKLANGFAYKGEAPERKFETASPEDYERWRCEREQGGDEIVFKRRARWAERVESDSHAAPQLPRWLTEPNAIGWVGRLFGYSFWAWCAFTAVLGTLLWGPWVSLAGVFVLYQSAKLFI